MNTFLTQVRVRMRLYLTMAVSKGIIKDKEETKFISYGDDESEEMKNYDFASNKLKGKNGYTEILLKTVPLENCFLGCLMCPICGFCCCC